MFRPWAKRRNVLQRRGPPLLCDKLLSVSSRCSYGLQNRNLCSLEVPSVPVPTHLPFCLVVFFFGTPCLPLLPRAPNFLPLLLQLICILPLTNFLLVVPVDSHSISNSFTFFVHFLNICLFYVFSRVETNCSFVISNSSSSNEGIFEYFRIPDRKVVANPIFKIPIG